MGYAAALPHVHDTHIHSSAWHVLLLCEIFHRLCLSNLATAHPTTWPRSLPLGIISLSGWHQCVEYVLLSLLHVVWYCSLFMCLFTTRTVSIIVGELRRKCISGWSQRKGEHRNRSESTGSVGRFGQACVVRVEIPVVRTSHVRCYRVRLPKRMLDEVLLASRKQKQFEGGLGHWSVLWWWQNGSGRKTEPQNQSGGVPECCESQRSTYICRGLPTSSVDASVGATRVPHYLLDPTVCREWVLLKVVFLEKNQVSAKAENVGNVS